MADYRSTFAGIICKLDRFDLLQISTIAESFIAVLKTELVYHTIYEGHQDIQAFFLIEISILFIDSIS